MVKKPLLVAMLGGAFVLGLGTLALAVVALRAISVDGGSPIEQPVAVELRVDPYIGRSGAVHPSGLGSTWTPGELKVMSSREDDGWLLFAAHHDDPAQSKVERVEIRLALDQPGVRAEASARWYLRHSTPFFTGNESANRIHGVITVDAARMPTAGDDRIIAYSLDGRRNGRPVYFSGKIVAGAGELDTMNDSVH
jgi:hypothetical protein